MASNSRKGESFSEQCLIAPPWKKAPPELEASAT
jgi:hypothetical protein